MSKGGGAGSEGASGVGVGSEDVEVDGMGGNNMLLCGSGCGAGAAGAAAVTVGAFVFAGVGIAGACVRELDAGIGMVLLMVEFGRKSIGLAAGGGIVREASRAVTGCLCQLRAEGVATDLWDCSAAGGGSCGGWIASMRMRRMDETRW